MNKKVLIAILLVVLAVASIAVLIMGKSGKNEVVVEDVNKSEVNKEIEVVEDANSNKPDGIEEDSEEIKNEQPEKKDYDSLIEEEKSKLVWYKIPEAGIKFYVSESVSKDLVYNVNYLKRHENSYKEINEDIDNFINKKDILISINFSSTTLINIDSKECDLDHAPGGTLSVYPGKITDDAYSNLYFNFNNNYSWPHKQFHNFFVIYSGPQSPCLLNDQMFKSIDFLNSLNFNINNLEII